MKDKEEDKVKENRNKIKKLLYYTLLMAVLIPVVIIFSQLISRAYYLLINMEQEGIILTAVIGICSYVIFIKELLKPSKCMYSKMYITYILLSAFVIPAIIIYGYNSGKGVFYYIIGMIMFITLPIIPCIMAEIINKISEKKLKRIKPRTFLVLILGIVINILLSIWGNWWNIISKNILHSLTEQFMIGSNSTSQALAWIFPMNSYGILSMLNKTTGKSILYFCIYLILIGLFSVLHLMVINKNE